MRRSVTTSPGYSPGPQLRVSDLEIAVAHFEEGVTAMSKERDEQKRRVSRAGLRAAADDVIRIATLAGFGLTATGIVQVLMNPHRTDEQMRGLPPAPVTLDPRVAVAAQRFARAYAQIA